MPSWSPKIAMLLFLVWRSGRFWSEYCPTYNNVASSYNIPNPSRQSRQDRPGRISGLLPKRTRNTPKDPANQPPSASSEPVRMPENQVSLPLRAYKTERETSFTTYTNQYNLNNPGPKQAKGTPIRASHCTNCKSNIPQTGVCTTCQESARYEVWYRVIISASGANVAVRWEMMANPSLSNEKDLAEENFDEGEDLFVLYEDAIVDKSFNPNPLA